MSDEDQILFFQLPSFLPLSKAALTAPVKTSEGGSITSIGKSSTKTEHTGSATWLENMPSGHMGKLLVYSSGAVKLRLGDTLYEVMIYYFEFSYTTVIAFCVLFEKEP